MNYDNPPSSFPASDKMTAPDWKPASEVDSLRVKLLEAQARIFQLEEQVKYLRCRAYTPAEKAKGIDRADPNLPNKGLPITTSRAPCELHMLPTRKYVFLAFRGVCFYCECILAEHTMTLDHQIPKSKGGINSRKNFVASCGPCNNTKGDRMPTARELERANFIREEFNAHPYFDLPDHPPIAVVPAKPSPQFTVRQGEHPQADDCSRRVIPS